MEIIKFIKTVDIKYLLSFLSFLILFDIFNLFNSGTSIFFLQNNFFENIRIIEVLIFLAIYYIYISVISKFIAEIIIRVFEFFLKKKKEVSSHYVEEYEILLECITKKNSVLYSYLKEEQQKKKIFHEGLSLYLGIIILIIIDFIQDNSICKILIKIIFDINYFNQYISIFIFLFILSLIFVLPFLILSDFCYEKNLIYINKNIKELIFEKEELKEKE